MIILIASEKDLAHEAKILSELFVKGLVFFHLRKPGKTKEEIRTYLNQIKPAQRLNVVLHQYHELAEEFQLKGIHLQERKRRDLGDELDTYMERFRTSNSNGFTISSSFHEIDELEACMSTFDYHLLSPVFSSISKEGYEGRGFDVTSSEKRIIGMGGVNENTIQSIKELGFRGIAVLGGVWNAVECVEAFTAIQTKHAEVYQS